jgi:UDP-N-acetylmuramate dehydrogenase
VSDRQLKEIFEKGLFRGQIKFNQQMSDYTSLKMGGPVEILAIPQDVSSLKNVMSTVRAEHIPVFILGAGTNVLVRDGGIDGVAVSLKAFKKIESIQNIGRIAPHLSLESDKESCAGLFVEAGVPLNNLIIFSKKNGLSGLEELAGIPGSVGGAVCMNAGSFHREIKDVIISVAVMKSDGNIEILAKDEIKFSYRSSGLPEDSVVISANILLRKDDSVNVSSRINEFLGRKKQSHPIEKYSAGCVFRNPEGDFAGRLIEKAGCKGMSIGDVEVSNIHANYFINRGRATSREFIELMERVKTKVEQTTGITLEPEIKIIGKDG